MRNRRQTVAMLAILALAAALVAGFGSTSSNAKTTATPMAMAHDGHGMQMTSTKSASKAVALPRDREAARRELGRAVAGDRVGLRAGRGEAVPERQVPVARPHQVLRQLHGRDREG